MTPNLTIIVFSIIFLLSGATGLIYQVAWVRSLSLFFGSDVYSAAITLSAFMGGLCVGSWLAGRLAKKLIRPLFVYAAVEIAISIYAIFFSTLLDAFDPLLTDVYREAFASTPLLYQAARAAVAFLVLLPPTALMGATLPLVVQHFAVADRVMGARTGHFYAMNTVGALIGTLAGGFILLPIMGVKHSIFAGAVINLSIGVAAAWLAYRSGDVVVEQSTRPRRIGRAFNRTLVLASIGLSGFAALALEVVWMRILVQSFSATVYAFSIMLACFLAGIFIGSEREARRVDQLERPAERFLRLELALFVYVTSLAAITYLVPGFFGILLWGLTAVFGGAFATSSILAQVIAAAILIMAPTVWLGAIFPLAVKVYTRDIQERALDTGRVYAANTFGALLGALTAGFALIPYFGTRVSLLVIGVVFLLAGLLLSPLSERPPLRFDRPLRVAAVASGLVLAIVGLMLPRQIVANFNMQQSTRPEVIYHGEGVSHTVDIVRTPTKNILMMVNGNVEADTTLVQRRHFILKAHLPLLLHENAKEVAVIGLGLGITLASTTRNPTVERIRLVELSPEMVEAHRYLRDLTGDVLSNKKIQLTIDDGRNFLNRTTERFDMITADPIHPRITGVGYLYSREYYEAVRGRLRPGGYILHWMPMYAISPRSFDVAFRTFASVFPNASFWYVRSHGLFVAGLEPLRIDFASIKKRFEHPDVRRDFESIGIRSAHDLMGHLLMDAKQIERYLKVSTESGARINTDDNAFLEYATPFEFLNRTTAIMQALLPFVGWDRSQITGAGETDLVKVEQSFQQRKSLLLPEQDQPVQ